MSGVHPTQLSRLEKGSGGSSLTTWQRLYSAAPKEFPPPPQNPGDILFDRIDVFAIGSDWKVGEKTIVGIPERQKLLPREQELKDGFALIIEDNSLAPEVMPGDIIIFKPGVKPSTNYIVLAVWDDVRIVRYYYRIESTVVLTGTSRKVVPSLPPPTARYFVAYSIIRDPWRSGLPHL